MADRVPIRTCVGCRKTRPQTELVRFHLDQDNHLREARNGPGRGAWVCLDALDSCFATAVSRKAFARTLRRAPEPDSLRILCDRWPSLADQ